MTNRRPARPSRPAAAATTDRSAVAQRIDRPALGRWLQGQRWYATPTTTKATTATTTTNIAELATIDLPTAPPLAIAIVDTTAGDRYQLLLDGKGSSTTAAKTTAKAATARSGEPAPDRAENPGALAALAALVADGAHVDGHPGVTATWLPHATSLGTAPARTLGKEQSNTSAVVGGTHVLKLYRRLQAGPHPELEIGRHLASVADRHRAPVAALAGWYELEAGATGDDGSTVLGVVQDLVPGAAEGWALVLAALADDPGRLLPRLHDLGTDLATLHTALARPSNDPAQPDDPEAPERFGATPLGASRLSAVAEATSTQADQLFGSKPATDAHAALAPMAGRGAAVARLATALVDAIGTDSGAAIRHHGDLHLGQVVVGADGWVFLDFEGEPARPLAERRRRHSPLRDVAGMVRSFAYAAASHRRSGGRRLEPGWEHAARAAFLDGYLSTADPTLLPASAVATRRLLDLFELEKVVYEIGYEVAHRPDWVPLPVQGLLDLLDQFDELDQTGALS